MPTTYRYTGQQEEVGIGLYDYGARWYDGALGRFIQPDPIVPQPGNPQSLNRYTYSLNNPFRYRDPTGHDPEDGSYFLLGVISQWGYNNAPLPSQREALAVKADEPTAEQVGRHMGNLAAVVQGAVEISGGAGVVTGGGALCLTGVGCVAGAPAVAAGIAVAVHGVAVATTAVAEEGQMLGKNGAQFPSQPIWKNKKARLEVENPAPGKRPGQIHLQEWGKGGHKWLYDPVTGTFLAEAKTGVLPPRWANELLEDEDFLAAIDKAMRYLGE